MYLFKICCLNKVFYCIAIVSLISSAAAADTESEASEDKAAEEPVALFPELPDVDSSDNEPEPTQAASEPIN